MSPANRVERVIRFPRPVYARLKRLAKSTGRSANAEVLVALESHLEWHERRGQGSRALEEAER